MEQKSQTSGLKTFDKITGLSVVNSSIASASSLYEKVKETNAITKNTFKAAEFGVQAFTQIVAKPLVNYFQTPINQIDEYLSDKVGTVTETAIKVSKNVANTYTTNADRFIKLKETTILKANQLKNLAQTTYIQVVNMVQMCFIYLNLFLENSFVKLVTEPILDLVEKSISYVLPVTKSNDKPTSTLKRIMIINQKVYHQLYSQAKSFFQTDLKLY